MVPAPMPRHQRVQIRLVEWLDDYGESVGGFAVCAPIDIVFSDDVVFFGPARAHLVDLDRPIRHAPDLCVEILSPSTEAADRGRKLQMFARYGVPEYWIVDPVKEIIEVYRLEAMGYVIAQRASGEDEVRSPVLPRMALRAGRIFS